MGILVLCNEVENEKNIKIYIHVKKTLKRINTVIFIKYLTTITKITTKTQTTKQTQTWTAAYLTTNALKTKLFNEWKLMYVF